MNTSETLPSPEGIFATLHQCQRKEDHKFAGQFRQQHSQCVARVGANFRNFVAHGLLSVDALRSETAFYLWWLLLRLIALPTAKMAAFVERRTN
jgi:hypothetical protein